MDKKEETKERMDIVNKISLSDADSAIKVNLLLQLGLGAGAFIGFVLLRKRMPWIYCANTKSSKTHPARMYQGILSWIIPVVTISDIEFFDLVGFDAFLFTETLKLLGMIFTVLAILLVPVLGAYYALFGGGKETQLLLRLSILRTKESGRSVNGIIPGISTWVVTLVVLYFLYMFYRKYIILRQLHLRDRSFSKSTPSIRRLAAEMHSVKKALNEIDLPSRSVLLRNLPSHIKNKDGLLDYLTMLNLGIAPEECHVVLNTKELERLLSRKREMIYCLEQEIQQQFIRINTLSLQNNFFAECVDNYDPDMDLISNAIQWGRRHKKDVKKVKAESVQEMFQTFCSSPFLGHLAQFNPKIGADKIRDYMHTIESLSAAIDEERSRKMSQIEDKQLLLPDVAEKSLHDPYALEREKPIFFSFGSMLHVMRQYREFSSGFPKETRSAFVTFHNAEGANAMKMALIGTGTFSCKAVEAPPPEELIWPTLSDPEPARIVRQFAGSIVTFVFVVFFVFFVFLVSSLINLSTFDKIVSWINPDLQAITQTREFRASFHAIFVPSVYSLFLALAPSAINAICLFEGNISHTEFQKNFGRKYSLFLFMNGFLAFIFSTTLIAIIDNKKAKQSVFESISVPVVVSSTFFLNTLIQKTFFGLMFTLLEPKRVFFRLVSHFLGGVRTRREEIEDIQPERINFGYYYPQVFLTFPMVLIYTVICPVFFILGAIHFMLSFLVYKSLFMYSHTSDLESGGGHWPMLCGSIFYALITFQVINIAHFLAMRQYVILLFVVPLVVITVGIGQSFNKIMKQRCNYLPNSAKELEEGANFMYKISLMRREVIKNWKESSQVEKVFLNLNHTKRSLFFTKEPYIYKDLSLLPSSSAAILPNWFCTVLCYLQAEGDSTIFRL
ncbi:calcium permeable stress-gated cation channel [Nematocida homosporus]|uniref:calcium permeable stress-gated cation channel n=1 Tax=Nematocida homosporus TaxID=1912981 RepID=UPI00222008F3|nr:calcium permeable stress-gated cation channel [Nematocida homosporus]KAI5186321.1 calcium permeable stress-gated cation channel [Nematocida homosporus]